MTVLLKPRLLIVDNDVEQTTALCDALRAEGYVPTGCACAKDALAALRAQPFDLLLADLLMPGMDGLALLRVAQEIDRTMVGVMITGRDTVDAAIAAMKAGALDYILTPFEVSVIVPALSRALAVRRLMRERNQADDELKLAHERIKEREAQLQAFMNNSPSVMFLKDLNGRYLHVNARFARCFGLDEHAIVAHTDAELFPPDQAAQFQANDALVLAARKPVEVEEIAEYGDGLHISIVCKFPIQDARGRITSLGGIATDITDRIRIEQMLKSSKDRLRMIADNVSAMIGYVDTEKRFRFSNKTYEDWLGVSGTAITGRKMRDVIGEELFGVLKPYIDRALDGEKVTFESELARGGKHRYLRTTYVPDVGSENEVRGIYGLIDDITALKLAEQELARLARCDSLTGLPNRATFNDRIGQALARAKRNRQPLALMYIDIDRFKSINDQYRYAIGDAVLKEFAGRLTRCVRATDTVARLGGDEFVVILERLDRRDNVLQVAEKVLAAMHPAFELADRQISIATSIGITFCGEEGPDAEELIRQADAAMYEAKRSGRNSYQIYDAEGAHSRDRGK